MMVMIVDSLQKVSLLPRPTVMFASSLKPNQVASLSRIVTDHGGTVVSNAAEATHVIHPNTADQDDTGDNEYLRTLKKRDKNLVHWWYFPDSYDEWVSPADVEGEDPEPIAKPQGPWELGARFLTDLDLFNEWMNEIDYLIAPASTASAPTGRQPSLRSSRKRTRDSLTDAPESEEPPSKTRRTRSDSEDSGRAQKEGKEEGDRRRVRIKLSGAPRSDVAQDMQDDHSDGENPAQPGPTSAPRAQPLPEFAVPLHASWFSLEEINQIEKDALPEFFDNTHASKTPEVYKQLRNFIVTLWRSAPSQYLSPTACRRAVAGDVCAILRMHAFLEEKGLINHNIGSLARPVLSFSAQALPTPPVSQFRADSVPAPAPSGAAAGPSTTSTSAQPTRSRSANLELRRPTFPATDSQQPRIHCESCRVDCTAHHFAAPARADRGAVNLCRRCFTSGACPPGTTAADFVLSAAEAKAETQAKDWTPQETSSLLEAVERFKDNWDEVAQYVGSKTREQCVLHFLRLPIEDAYLDDQLSSLGLAPAIPMQGAPLLQGQPLPFSDPNNPVLAAVAYMASAVHPKVAAAAAQAAIDAHDTMFFAQESEAAAEPRDAAFQVGASTALAASAVKAKLLAESQERELQRTFSAVVDAQMKKVELRIRQYEELEKILELERDQVEVARHQIFAERVALSAAQAGVSLETLVARRKPIAVTNTGVPSQKLQQLQNQLLQAQQQISLQQQQIQKLQQQFQQPQQPQYQPHAMFGDTSAPGQQIILQDPEEM
eukprot:TRINITY_DN5665_c0_g1_i1.p1 TRINITY_DN5665_c0_g1~~TRINITY_DN5665_c0_g1_i1.p1  ORF type:complete len:897 (-),score=178.61 TRINITY_DN5665_c0_g1_i1:36-2354(-)